MEREHFYLTVLAFTCALVAAKWAMELGISQFGQLLWGVAALFFGPFVLLLLYIRLIRTRQTLSEPGGQWLSNGAASKRPEAVDFKK
jgi:hypothetical protein